MRSIVALAIALATLPASARIRHCDDACKLRIDQKLDRLEAQQAARWAAMARSNAEYERKRTAPFVRPAPKPDGPHAERMRGVNILKKD